jgi:uncharacterized protein with PQ loop repeat
MYLALIIETSAVWLWYRRSFQDICRGLWIIIAELTCGLFPMIFCMVFPSWNESIWSFHPNKAWHRRILRPDDLPNKFYGAGILHVLVFLISQLSSWRRRNCVACFRGSTCTFIIACLQWHLGGEITANFKCTCTNIWRYTTPPPSNKEKKKEKNYKSELCHTPPGLSRYFMPRKDNTPFAPAT